MNNRRQVVVFIILFTLLAGGLFTGIQWVSGRNDPASESQSELTQQHHSDQQEHQETEESRAQQEQSHSTAQEKDENKDEKEQAGSEQTAQDTQEKQSNNESPSQIAQTGPSIIPETGPDGGVFTLLSVTSIAFLIVYIRQQKNHIRARNKV